MNQRYLETARLLTQVAPFVLSGDTFALKGGTAINLFVRDMPRLSVDLDLVFVDHQPSRDEALAQITEHMRAAGDRLTRIGLEPYWPTASDGIETKLLLRRQGIEVKVEVNYVTRGTVRPVRRAGLSPKARETLLADLDIPIVSLDDMYGSKLVAAMDRQHPRDLFDVMQLFAHEGITPDIRRAFVAYLASHHRPVHEVLFPALRNVESDYTNNFVGMTADPVPLHDLLAARDRMVDELQRGLDPNERAFLLGLIKNQPDWSLLGIEHLDQLPGIRWKLHNLSQLQVKDPGRFAQQYEELARRLESEESRR